MAPPKLELRKRRIVTRNLQDLNLRQHEALGVVGLGLGPSLP